MAGEKVRASDYATLQHQHLRREWAANPHKEKQRGRRNPIAPRAV